MNRFKIHNNCREYRKIIRNKIKEPLVNAVKISKPFILVSYKLKSGGDVSHDKICLSDSKFGK